MAIAFIILAILIAAGAGAGVFGAKLLSVQPGPLTNAGKIKGAVLGGLIGAGVWFVMINMLVRLAGAGG